MTQRLQEAALQPRGHPMAGDCPTVPPAYPSFKQSIPMVPSVHSLQEGSGGHTDYKTTRLHSHPTESITKHPEEENTENTEKPSRGSLQRQISKTAKWGLYVWGANKGARS